MLSAAQKLIIAASLAGIGGGVWYFFIRKEPDVKKISGGGKTTPSGGGGKTTPSGGGAIAPPPDGGTTTPVDIYGTDGKVHVASGKPILGYDMWTGIPYYEPRPVEKVKDDLMKAVQYVLEWMTKTQNWNKENIFFVQRVWSDRAYDKSPVAKADLELLDKLVKKAALEEAV